MGTIQEVLIFWAVLVKKWYVVKYPFPVILVRDDIHIQWPSSYDKACEFVQFTIGDFMPSHSNKCTSRYKRKVSIKVSLL